jgi:hypothetical protein
MRRQPQDGYRWAYRQQGRRLRLRLPESVDLGAIRAAWRECGAAGLRPVFGSDLLALPDGRECWLG